MAISLAVGEPMMKSINRDPNVGVKGGIIECNYVRLLELRLSSSNRTPRPYKITPISDSLIPLVSLKVMTYFCKKT